MHAQNTEKTAPRPVIGRPWKKGESGNPGGRPKDFLSAALRQKLTPDKAEALAETLVNLALAGDLRAAELVFARVEGKALDRREVGEPGAFDYAARLTDEDLRKLLHLVDSAT